MSNQKWLPSLAAVALAGFGAIFWLGCKPEAPEAVAPTALVIRDRSDLDATENIERTAILVQGGSEYAVDIKTKTEGETFEIGSFRHGEQFERELYHLFPAGFGLRRAAGETFEPPIPLLRYPLTVGDTWTWKGTAAANDSMVDASATVTTERKMVGVCGIQTDAVVTKVTLSFPPLGGQEPVSRDLIFYFSKDRGLFKREFGATSRREPVCR